MCSKDSKHLKEKPQRYLQFHDSGNNYKVKLTTINFYSHFNALCNLLSKFNVNIQHDGTYHNMYGTKSTVIRQYLQEMHWSDPSVTQIQPILQIKVKYFICMYIAPQLVLSSLTSLTIKVLKNLLLLVNDLTYQFSPLIVFLLQSLQGQQLPCGSKFN